MLGVILLAVQSYLPIPGGFAISNGEAEFSRPLYGWHGSDVMLEAKKILPWTGDRPKVRLSAYPCNDPDRIPDLGTLAFETQGRDVDYRYVYGRAEYDIAGIGSVRLVRSDRSDALIAEVTGDIAYRFDGEWAKIGEERDGDITYLAFGRRGMGACRSPKAEFEGGAARLEALAKALEPKTPSALLNSLVACQLIAADALLEEKAICHGVTGWHCPFAGWRGAYAFIASERYDDFKANARLYFDAQHEDGRIPCYPDRDSIYNMNEVFVDAVLRYWLKTHDDDFMRDTAYDGIRRHLDWGERTMRESSSGLFESWLNAWNTDNKWSNGGAGTIASAYYAFAYATMGEVAKSLGREEDAKRFAARAEEIKGAIDARLWNDADGYWGEYRETDGAKQLMIPDSSVIYTAIDSLGDIAKGRRALDWFERNVPYPYSSNKLPRFYSSCGIYQQENIHLALAYWQCGERAKAWRIFEDAIASAARGVKAGPGELALQHDAEGGNLGHVDFGDTVGIFLRAYTEAFSSLTADDMTAEIEWNHAWGQPKGEGTDYHLPDCTASRFVSLAKYYNQNLRTLHERTYSPRIGNFAFSDWVPRTLTEHGRAWWEALEGVGDVNNVRGGHNVPEKLDWPATGLYDTHRGIIFRLGPENGKNVVFTSRYDEFPDSVTIPLSGKAKKIVFLTALSTNPNHDWNEAARLTVAYKDGESAVLRMVPPDNCDDWLNYLQLKPYALTGERIMFDERAHANLLALDLDGERELDSVTLECTASETLAGILAITMF